MVFAPSGTAFDRRFFIGNSSRLFNNKSVILLFVVNYYIVEVKFIINLLIKAVNQEQDPGYLVQYCRKDVKTALKTMYTSQINGWK